MSLHRDDVWAVALPAVVLLFADVALPFVFSPYVDAPGIHWLYVVRRVVAIGAVLVAAGVGYGRLGGHGAAVESPGTLFAAFLLAWFVAVVAAPLIGWLIAPEIWPGGPEWHVFVNAISPEGVGVAFAGLAGAAIADLRAK